jgi:hypothetical protein
MASYHYATYPIATLYNYARKGEIDLEPSYQREVVWTDDQQADLLTTIIDDKLPCPPINLVENKDPSVPKYECMDGKNRLQTLIKFIGNDLEYQGRVYSDLPEEDKIEFTSTNIQVCIFTNMPYEQRREYFRRIQQGRVLRQTEICWSFDNKPVMMAIRKVRSSKIDKIKNMWDTKRYSDLVLLCNTMAMIMGQNIESDLAGHSTTMTKWVKNSSDETNLSSEGRTLSDVIDMLDKLLEVKPVSRVRNIVILDVARLIIAKGLESAKTITRFKEFVETLNEYIDTGETTQGVVKDYGDIINNNKALSSQYSRKVVAQRHEIIKRVLV